MKQPFVIFALPRSRTAWLASFLTYGDWTCGHDELRHARSPADITAWLSQDCTGSVETMGAPFWRYLTQRYPDTKIVVVRRPVGDVVDSLVRLGFDRDTMMKIMRVQDRKLDQIEKRVPGVLSVSFADLAQEATCAGVFEHCLPYQHDAAWWSYIAPLNLQINMKAMVRYCQVNLPQLNKLGLTIKHQIIAGMPHRMHQDGELVLQQEPLDIWRRDAVSLFEDHCVAVGESPAQHELKDWSLMRMLEQVGCLQITTGRSNGRIFGYLMTVVSPAIESPDILTATNTFFYASREFPGLGMKLQRASIAALKTRGATEVLMRAGIRGSGPKMGAMYRRLGAEFIGGDYLLQLGNT